MQSIVRMSAPDGATWYIAEPNFRGGRSCSFTVHGAAVFESQAKADQAIAEVRAAVGNKVFFYEVVPLNPPGPTEASDPTGLQPAPQVPVTPEPTLPTAAATSEWLLHRRRGRWNERL